MKTYSINSPIRYKGKTLKSGAVEIPEEIAKDLVNSGAITELIPPPEITERVFPEPERLPEDLPQDAMRLGAITEKVPPEPEVSKATVKKATAKVSK